MENLAKNRENVVLVSGVSSGNGNATASLLAERGYRVFGTSRDPSRFAPIPGVEVVALDVRSPESIQNCVRTVLDRAGHLDVLINNAGYTLAGAIEESNDEEIAAQFDTNFYGLARLTRAVLPGMRSRRRGRIINMSSLVGRVSAPYLGIYSASKFAVEGYSEALFHELLPFGIHVSLIEPGFIRAPLWDHMVSTKAPIAAYDPWGLQMMESVRQHVAKAPKPDLVAKGVLRAIEAPRPRLRYAVGPDANLVLRLRSWTPESLFNRVLRREFGLELPAPTDKAA